MVMNETQYNCYGFELELDDGPIVTYVYASKYLSIKEAEIDIKNRFSPNEISACLLIEDPMKDVMHIQQKSREYYDEIQGGIKSTKDLSSRRKRRVED